jgi:hypothetical protein
MLLNRYRQRLIVTTVTLFSWAWWSCKREPTLFEKLPASVTGIQFENKLLKKDLFNILYYLYYYNGGGVATGDINNDGLADIFFTANDRGKNKLYLNKGNMSFQDITATAGVAGISDWCSGATMADVNGDGWLDIYVSAVNRKFGLKGHNELYINNGNNSFTEKSQAYGLDYAGLTTQAVFFDYDHDNDLDCYVLNQSYHPHANVVDTSNRNRYDTISGDVLYRNDLMKTGKFTDVSGEAGIYQSKLGYGLGIAIADFNNDGWEDIYVGNDFHENDYYYLNNGNGTFTESGAKHFRHYSRFSMGNDAADFNNDGQMDIITVDMLPPDEKTLKTYGSDENPDIYRLKLESHGYQHQYSRNCLQRNNGDGVSFSETGLYSGVSATDWSWAPLFADFDNDGNKDLFISSGIVKRPVDLDYIRFISDLDVLKGRQMTDKYDDEAIARMPDGSSHPFVYRGDGVLGFTDMSENWGTAGMKGYFNGSSYADLDNDGDLDLVINALNTQAVILKNNTVNKKSISLSFKADSGNTFGIGCKAFLFQQGKMQYQQLMLTRGFQSSSDVRLHFGLDTTAVIDSIIVVWPDQKSEVVRNPEPGKPLLFQYKNASTPFNAAFVYHKAEPIFNNVSQEVAIAWRHRENPFVDFNVQYLIPHAESTRGPKIAVGDVNRDGLDDFYACGAKFQPGVLMIQQRNGTFIPSDTALFTQDAICEEVDAAFFDADGNGSLDLYVVSGGNEVPQDVRSFEDRLYINDGKGHFSKSTGFLRQQYENKSCVAASDIDHDGDQDVFVGNLASPTAFGLPKTSFLLLNDGKAHFSPAGSNTISLESIGMVTAAAFADLNKDGWDDLVVTGEWMPVKVYINNRGTFQAMDLAASTGLWQTIYLSDVNGDGETDILAGNWGQNSKLFAGKAGPVKLYVKDFDMNGSTEQVMTYVIGKEEYTFLGKDELERRMPVLKKAYLTYGEVAGKTVQYMFYDLFKDYTELKAEVLASSAFINDGKGNFSRVDLPRELQLAPVMSFASLAPVNAGSFMAAGNFFGVIPYEGRYDALQPTAFTFDRKFANFKPLASLPDFFGEVRDMKWLNTAGGGKMLMVARNNSSPVFLRP